MPKERTSAAVRAIARPEPARPKGRAVPDQSAVAVAEFSVRHGLRRGQRALFAAAASKAKLALHVTQRACAETRGKLSLWQAFNLPGPMPRCSQ